MIQHEKEGKEHLNNARYKEAEQSFKAALEEAKKYRSPNAYLSQQQKILAVYYFARGEFEEAENFFKQSLSTEINLLGSQNLEICKSLNHLGLVYQLHDEYEKAEKVYRQALKIAEKTPFLKYPEVDSKLHYLSLHLLAVVLLNSGERDEALRLCEEVSARIRNVDPKDRETLLNLHDVTVRYCHPDQNPDIQNTYAWLLHGFAEQLQRKVLGTVISEEIISKPESEPVPEIMESVQELISSYDEIWRPADIYRNEDAQHHQVTAPPKPPNEDSTIPDESIAKTDDQHWRP